MIRTGYLRWEIEVEDVRSPADALAREVVFLARPSHRVVRVKSNRHAEAAEQFTRGEASYDAVLRTLEQGASQVELTIPDVGPARFRYSEADRAKMLRYWLDKLQREASAFAHEVVRSASSFPQLVIASPALRAGYARMVEAEIFRVIEGKSKPQPTSEEPIDIDATTYKQGVPELVAAELVRDVVEPKEFHEFCQFDVITVKNGDKFYRIPRRPHGLIEVWDANTRRPVARLCVVFQDAGMPPSDEVVMKYLLAKHQPDMLWQVGVRFSPPAGRFEMTAPRRWTVD
ncbi:hypothetical protein OJF2_58970 [Aquisphaera giovannonii]|uniref:Uncharacterized protein n=1 Tax=Aquisphaera giovannonii TaxID=406548 RepID=A0A5B9WA41_9BACT|nr:hypothetical protein [Aquisphaera giovannonii]QEH37307.1 hypothetical protein OJF2_58970 [Aquisphaera giovannonii]